LRSNGAWTVSAIFPAKAINAGSQIALAARFVPVVDVFRLPVACVSLGLPAFQLRYTAAFPIDFMPTKTPARRDSDRYAILIMKIAPQSYTGPNFETK